MLGIRSLLFPHAKLESGLSANIRSPVMCSEGGTRWPEDAACYSCPRSCPRLAERRKLPAPRLRPRFSSPAGKCPHILCLPCE